MRAGRRAIDRLSHRDPMIQPIRAYKYSAIWPAGHSHCFVRDLPVGRWLDRNRPMPPPCSAISATSHRLFASGALPRSGISRPDQSCRTSRPSNHNPRHRRERAFVLVFVPRPAVASNKPSGRCEVARRTAAVLRGYSPRLAQECGRAVSHPGWLGSERRDLGAPVECAATQMGTQRREAAGVGSIPSTSGPGTSAHDAASITRSTRTLSHK